MSIILTDGKTMVSDGLVISGWTIVSTTSRKILKVGKAIIGTIGLTADRDRFIAWFKDQAKDKPSLDETFEALVLESNGQISRFDSKLESIALSAPQAIGCGYEAALILMDLEYDLENIIKMVSSRNIGVGGEITKLTFDL